jgi:PRTRC genetic system ThiF family protein
MTMTTQTLKTTPRDLPFHWLSNERPINVLLIGAGGNGSEFLDGLLRLHAGMQAVGGSGLNVVVMDDDEVSESNCVRQRFWPHEVGQNKAVALAHRTNMMMGTGWQAVPKRFEKNPAKGMFDLVVTAVDNLGTRRKVAKEQGLADFWLDMGCDVDRGQVVFGRWGHDKLNAEWPTALAHFPDMATREETKQQDSCSAADSLMKQDLMINQAVAGAAINMLWKALRTGKMNHNGVMIDLADSFSQAIPFMPDSPKH